MNEKLLPIYLTAIMVVLVCTANAQTNLGIGLFHGTDQKNKGIDFNGQFFLTDHLAIAPHALYFFSTRFSDTKQRWIELNLNAHFYLPTKYVKPYILTGLNLAYVRLEGFGRIERNLYPAFNIGTGFNVDIGKRIMPYGEVRFVFFNETDGLIFGGGLRLKL